MFELILIICSVLLIVWDVVEYYNRLDIDFICYWYIVCIRGGCCCKRLDYICFCWEGFLRFWFMGMYFYYFENLLCYV